MTLGKEHPQSATPGLFIDSNEVIDLHQIRMTIARYRIPRSVWSGLYFIAFSVTLLVNAHAGLSSGRSWLVTAFLAMVLSSVLKLIVDIDRPGATRFSVSQQALIELRASMEKP